MKKYGTLIIAGLKRHKGSLSGIFILIFLISLSLTTVLTMRINSGQYIQSEIHRAGFGDLTVWVSGVSDMEMLVQDINDINDVEKIDTQNIIYSDYVINGQESDSEGQLIFYKSDEKRYRFFNDKLIGYRLENPNIQSGEIYVSPSLISMFGVKIGDQITFSIARDSKNKIFTVKGFYEDPFMGSSMIGMKGFLISEADWITLVRMIDKADYNALAREGAMLHITKNMLSSMSVTELNASINENINLLKYTESVHSENTIVGFMLILQNAFSGLLLAFVVVLFCVAIIVIGHSINSMIETDYVNMGILKTIGFTGNMLRQVQLILYLISVLLGLLAGFVTGIWLTNMVCQMILTTTGVLYPTRLPLGWCFIAFALVLALLIGCIIMKTRGINNIAPLNAIRENGGNMKFLPKRTLRIYQSSLNLHIAVRQLMTGRRRYVGTCIVAMLLVFFSSLVGRMDSWLGTNGQGLMDAFNPADLDLGVQIFNNQNFKKIEKEILQYSDITDSYLLAMPNVAIDGIDFTANVITDPERFHILSGETCIADNEVVLTEFVAADMGVTVGDIITVSAANGSEEYTVSGIYQCANDMGNNIGMSREGYQKIGQDSPQIWCHHIFLADSLQKRNITEDLEKEYGGDIHIHENTWPGLNGIISAMQVLMIFMYGIVSVFIMIVTILSGNKILSAEQKDLGIYKAIGFSNSQLRVSFAVCFGLVAIIGSILGIIMASIITDPLVSTLMKFAGISNFMSHPNFGEMMFPAVSVVLLFVGFAYLTAGKIKKVDLTVLVNE